MRMDLRDRETWRFLVTNYIPRRFLTRLIGWFSRVESPVLTRASIAVWRLFVDELDLSDARKREDEFTSLRDCFVRELAPGARPVEAAEDVVTSPCDAVVGAHGELADTQLFQLKGSPYELGDLVPDARLVERFRGGRFVTLRLRSTMYHRFHAPLDCRVEEVTYVSGDTFNVDPPTLKRIRGLFTRNERALIPLTIDGAVDLLLVPVAAILVASMRLHCLPAALNIDWQGPNRLACDASYGRGDEMGWFEHGSTIVMLATRRFEFAPGLAEGKEIRMGRALMRTADADASGEVTAAA
jgi:phosphatidylserine decarboxylase